MTVVMMITEIEVGHCCWMEFRFYFYDRKKSFAGGVDVISDRESGRTTPRLTPPRKESTGAPYRSIRFGFRHANVVRPASTGLNPKITDCDTGPNNNCTGKLRVGSVRIMFSSFLITNIFTQQWNLVRKVSAVHFVQRVQIKRITNKHREALSIVTIRK